MEIKHGAEATSGNDEPYLRSTYDVKAA